MLRPVHPIHHDIAMFAGWKLVMIAFWTTRSSAFFDVFLVAEILLSGRMMPMSLLPPWLRDAAELTPFPWTFGFPVESLLGTLSTGELVRGLVVQLLWIAVAATAVALVWRRAVRRHTSVGH